MVVEDAAVVAAADVVQAQGQPGPGLATVVDAGAANTQQPEAVHVRRAIGVDQVEVGRAGAALDQCSGNAVQHATAHSAGRRLPIHVAAAAAARFHVRPVAGAPEQGAEEGAHAAHGCSTL